MTVEFNCRIYTNKIFTALIWDAINILVILFQLLILTFMILCFCFYYNLFLSLWALYEGWGCKKKEDPRMGNVYQTKWNVSDSQDVYKMLKYFISLLVMLNDKVPVTKGTQISIMRHCSVLTQFIVKLSVCLDHIFWIICPGFVDLTELYTCVSQCQHVSRPWHWLHHVTMSILSGSGHNQTHLPSLWFLQN